MESADRWRNIRIVVAMKALTSFPRMIEVRAAGVFAHPGHVSKRLHLRGL